MLQSGMSRYVLLLWGRIETYQIATYSIRTLLKMDYWSPKHVELLNVMNKINHQILCILDYIHIAKWYTVHAISNYLRKTLYRGLQFVKLLRILHETLLERGLSVLQRVPFPALNGAVSAQFHRIWENRRNWIRRISFCILHSLTDIG